MRKADALATADAAWSERKGPCLKVADWLARDIPSPDFLMGEWFSTTSRAILTAPTGLGKTNFGMALGFATASGSDFLHWRAHRPCKVLYIDGEMSRRLVKVRLADAVRRAGGAPAGFLMLCRDDLENMPPLNSVEGQQFVDRIIADVGGVDALVADNVMSLLSGDMKEEEGWSQTLPWIRGLTRRSVGQLWIHHTGHDETKSYGTSTRMWQLDTAILLERQEDADADIAFRLSFTKARERTPDNRTDFEPVNVRLAGDRWEVAEAQRRAAVIKLTDKQKNALDVLRNLTVETGRPAPADAHIPAGVAVVSIDRWRSDLFKAGVLDPDAANPRSDYARLCDQLKSRGCIGIWSEVIWLAR